MKRIIFVSIFLLFIWSTFVSAQLTKHNLIEGNLSIEANIYVGDAVTDSAYFTARIGTTFEPNADLAYDLGIPSLRWREVHANGMTMAGPVYFNGDVTMGDSPTDTIYFPGRIGSSFEPTADAAFDLGTPGARWRILYADTIVAQHTNFTEEGGFSMLLRNGDAGVDSITNGDIVRVQIGSIAEQTVIKTTSQNQTPIGVANNTSSYGGTVEVVVVGRGYIKVESDIIASDTIGPTSTPGVGRNGVSLGKIVGTAITNYNPATGKCLAILHNK